MRFPRLLVFGMFAAFCGLGLSCSNNGDNSGGAVTLQGAGATFPAPLYERWFADYSKDHPEVRINYQGIGSGAGINQFTQGLVNFGASDAAMTDEQIAQVKQGVQLLPMTAGSVVLAYNPDGLPEGLKLSREDLAGICLGTITNWKDIKASNGSPLPDKKLTFVHRADGSGTSFVFTTHLSAISSEWKDKVGAATSPAWPTGVGGKGNDGVSALIKQTPGAIGYIEYGYAQQTKQPTAALENKKGEYVKATPESGLKALEGVEIPDNLRTWIPDPEGKDAYPIVTYTWLLCYKQYDDANVARILKDVIKYGLTDGQKVTTEMGYIPLPQKVVDLDMKALDNIKP